MAKVILICGKICSGKSYYTKQLMQKINAVVLSCDEVLFDFCLENVDEKHDELVAKIKQYFYKKSEEIVLCGANVILDFGFWSKNERDNVYKYYSERNIPFEWHYLDISDEDWKINIEQRNKLVCDNKVQAYYVDEGLLLKLNSKFEKPSKQEIDYWYINSRK
jgi:predicted kinase